MDVMILCGSKSDWKIVEDVERTLQEFGVSYTAEICSAHRNPEKLDTILKTTNAKVIIAVAGLSAALGGVCAARTIKPVIAVPVNVKLNGLDALLSSMQIPPGIPVATVGIDNGKNAALLAVEMLAISDKALSDKLLAYRKTMQKK